MNAEGGVEGFIACIRNSQVNLAGWDIMNKVAAEITYYLKSANR